MSSNLLLPPDPQAWLASIAAEPEKQLRAELKVLLEGAPEDEDDGCDSLFGGVGPLMKKPRGPRGFVTGAEVHTRLLAEEKERREEAARSFSTAEPPDLPATSYVSPLAWCGGAPGGRARGSAEQEVTALEGHRLRSPQPPGGTARQLPMEEDVSPPHCALSAGTPGAMTGAPPPPLALPAPPPPQPVGPAPKTVGGWYHHQQRQGAFGKPPVSAHPVMVIQWPTLMAKGTRALVIVLAIQPGDSLCAATTLMKIHGVGKDELTKCDTPDWAPEPLSKSANVTPLHATWRKLIENNPMFKLMLAGLRSGTEKNKTFGEDAIISSLIATMMSTSTKAVASRAREVVHQDKVKQNAAGRLAAVPKPTQKETRDALSAAREEEERDTWRAKNRVTSAQRTELSAEGECRAPLSKPPDMHDSAPHPPCHPLRAWCAYSVQLVCALPAVGDFGAAANTAVLACVDAVSAPDVDVAAVRSALTDTLATVARMGKFQPATPGATLAFSVLGSGSGRRGSGGSHGGGPVHLERDLNAMHEWQGEACSVLQECMDLTAGCDLTYIKKGLQANPR